MYDKEHASNNRTKKNVINVIKNVMQSRMNTPEKLPNCNARSTNNH